MKALSIIGIVVAGLGIFGTMLSDNPEDLVIGWAVYGFYLAVSICLYNLTKGAK